MNAIALNLNETITRKEIPEIARSHMEVLIELLRDVNLEKRMETLIKAEGLMKEEEFDGRTLEAIRIELEEDLLLVRKMIFMVDQARYFSEAN